jgi:hypothetical protein
MGQRAAIRLSEKVWVPAFAGKSEEGNKAPYVASRHFPQRGKINDGKSSPLGGSTGAAGEGGRSPYWRKINAVGVASNRDRRPR